MIHVEQHHAWLKDRGLHTLEGVKRFEGKIVELSPGRRDVIKIEIPRADGFPFTLFLKRHWKVNRMKSLLTFARRFRIESLARREWENAMRLQQAGFQTASLVARGEECGLFGESFSFLITEQASGSCSLEEFCEKCRDHQARQRLFDALASEVRRVHSAGISMPDLFARHVFFSPDAGRPSFCFIDVARLETGQSLSLAQRARSLAALNVSVPASRVSLVERLRFLRQYAGSADLKLFSLIRKRTEHLLQRRRYSKLHLAGDNYPGSALRFNANPALMTTAKLVYRGREKYDLKTALAYQRVSPAKHRAEMNLLDRAFTFVPKNYSVLDVPCGGGRVSIHLAHQGYTVAAADFSEAMVDIATKNLANAGLRCVVGRQDIEAMTYPDHNVDAIVCFRLFHHFPDAATRRRCISQLCRVAKRMVAISYFSPLSATSLRRTLVAAAGGKRSPKYSTSLREIQGYFQLNGFTLVRNFARMPFIHTLHVALFQRKESD